MGGAIDYSDFSNPYGPSLFGDEVRSPGPFAGAQLGWNYQSGQAVVGLQADASWANLQGTFTCLQPALNVPNLFAEFLGGAFGATCQADADWFGTVTGRAGLAVGPQGRILLYGKGGLAWVHTNIDMALNNAQSGFFGPDNARSQSSFTQLGWTLGGGVEYALGGRWSLGLEYDYLHFGKHNVPTPQSGPFANAGFLGIFGATAPDGTPASVSQDIHAVKLAVNYQLWDKGSLSDSPVDPFTNGVVPARTPGFGSEVGGRYVYAWTRFQQDLGNKPLVLPINNSRLTWDNLGTNGGELFARIDTPENVMVKGFVGLGQGDQGHIYDEDWGLLQGDPVTHVFAYQLTQHATTTKIDYFTLDVGYDWLRGPDYKVASYVGYNYFHYAMNALGCTFLMFSPPQACDPAAPPRQLTLQEEDTWISWRLGTSAELMLTPRLKLSGDVAYLPYVRYAGVDNHPLRTTGPSTYSPARGHGTGVQVEGLLSYDITSQLSVGAGGRYWSMSIPHGTSDFFTAGNFVPQRFAVEHTAVFVQGSYKLGGDSD